MTRSRCFALSIASALFLPACGGSTATFNLYDAPPPGVTSVKITVATVEAHVAGADEARNADPNDKTIDNDGSWQTLVVDRTIDLVLHEGETAADVLGQLSLPVGKVTQIRLKLDANKTNTATLNGTDCNLDLSRVDRNGVKIDHVFKAFPSKDGSKLEVWIDFALDQSLTPQGGCFVLGPQLHLTRVKADGNDVGL